MPRDPHVRRFRHFPTRSQCAAIALCLLVLTAPAAANDYCGQWLPGTPSYYYNPRMAFDSIRGVAVLFGGSAPGGLSNSTFEWNGSVWRKRLSAHAPSARNEAAMAFDAARGVVVLFGGYSNGPLGETWEWDGVDWTLRTPANSPLPRYGHALAYDSVRKVTVLHGGMTPNGVRTNDTWEWDGVNWTQRFPATSPATRYGHCLAYDSARNVTVLFGGFTTLGFETWEYDGTTWTRRFPVHQPPHAFGMAMAYDSARGVCVVVSYPGHVSEWDGADWKVTLTNLRPSHRLYLAATYDTVRQVTVLSGGYPDVYPDPFGDTWMWDGSSWTYAIPPRVGHAFAYDSVRGVTVVFGGYSEVSPSHYSVLFNDTWEWDGENWLERHPPVSPPPQAYHAMSFDSNRGVMVMYGTADTEDDVWEWDGLTWLRRSTVIKPSSRGSFGSAFDAARNRTVLFGGYDANGHNNETWEWDGANWTRMFPATSPSPRSGFGICYDSLLRKVHITGGSLQSGNNGLSWSWDGVNWARLPESTGTNFPFSAFSMAFDEARGALVAFSFGTTYTWGGRFWNYESNPSDLAQQGGLIAYDAMRNRTVLFGPAYTWEYAATPIMLTQQPANATVCEGQRAQFQTGFNGSFSTHARWKRGSTHLLNGGRISGAITYLLTIDPVTLADAGTDYNCVITNTCGQFQTSFATLTVYPRGSADVNGDGRVDGGDVQSFLDHLLSPGPPSPGFCASDMNGDGSVTTADVPLFIARVLSN